MIKVTLNDKTYIVNSGVAQEVIESVCKINDLNDGSAQANKLMALEIMHLKEYVEDNCVNFVES